MPTLIEVWESRLGIQEVPGKKHNPIIVGWAKDAGHPEIVDDETSWCSLSMCSAAKEAELPYPPVNVNPMAKSWMTQGVAVAVEDVAPGDVMVWQRGKPGSWMGHVNCVKEVRRRGNKVEVRNIGGNQGGLAGGDAVTLTGWQDASAALAIRRLVPATVPALRKAGSTTIKGADTKEKVAIGMVFITPILKGIEYVLGMFGPVDVPTFATLPEGLSWWQTVLRTANGLLDYALAHPYLALTIIGGLALWGISRRDKSGRVKEHAAGIPIAAEVVKLEGGQ